MNETLRKHHKHQLANHIEVARDGVEALNFIFATGDYTHRSIEDHPRVILLDLKLPRVNVWKCSNASGRTCALGAPDRYNDLVPGRS
jgi:CheY-like chemotaxis protein